MIYFSVQLQSDMVTKQGHAEIQRDTNRELLERHAKETLPKHFQNVPETSPGGGGYRYRRRNRKYETAKRIRLGHTRPNVQTGRFEQAVLTKVRVTATQHKASMITRGASEHPVAAWQRDEVARVSRRELREYSKWKAAEYARRAQSPKYRRRRSHGGGRRSGG